MFDFKIKRLDFWSRLHGGDGDGDDGGAGDSDGDGGPQLYRV